MNNYGKIKLKNMEDINMALVKCPECGKDVSDKSKQCIHCGFPIETNKKDLYDVIYYGFPNFNSKASNQAKLIGFIRQLYTENISLSEAKNIIDNPPQTFFKGIEKQNAEWAKMALTNFNCRIEVVKSSTTDINSLNENLSTLSANGGTIICPRCGSNQITTGQRGFSLLTGFIGSSKTVNRCGNCGYSWKP